MSNVKQIITNLSTSIYEMWKNHFIDEDHTPLEIINTSDELIIKLADEQTKPLKEEIERLRDVSTQHLLDYTESNVLLQEKVAELEASLSLAKKENEELKTLNEKTEREWEGQRKRVKEYKDKMEAELTSVKEQLQTAEKELGNLKVRNANIVGDSTWTDIKINELKEQNKELAEALDEVVIYLGDEKDFERAERFLIKKIKPALTNYKQTKT